MENGGGEIIDNQIGKALSAAFNQGALNHFDFTDELEKSALPTIIAECIPPDEYRTNLLLTALTVWQPNLRDGRALAFKCFKEDSDTTKRLKEIALLNIEIFGRGTTLNERLLNFANNSKNEFVMIALDFSNEASFDIRLEDNKLFFDIGYIWNDLKSTKKIKYLKRRKDFLDSQGEQFLLIDAARALRLEFSKTLEEQRHEVLNRLLLKNNYLKSLLFSAMENMKNPGEVVFKKKKGEIIPVSQNFANIMSFIKFFQALAYLLPDVDKEAKKVYSIAYFPLTNSQPPKASYPSRGAAINLIGSRNFNIIDINTFSFLGQIHEVISKKIEKETAEHNELDEHLFEAAAKQFLKESGGSK
jgi:hypothetical protein